MTSIYNKNSYNMTIGTGGSHVHANQTPDLEILRDPDPVQIEILPMSKTSIAKGFDSVSAELGSDLRSRLGHFFYHSCMVKASFKGTNNSFDIEFLAVVSFFFSWMTQAFVNT